MTYTVVWALSARNALADIWNQALDRQAVTQAANRIDRELRIDAHGKGRIFHNRRLLVVSPLAVTFAVDPGDCKATVLQVRRVVP